MCIQVRSQIDDLPTKIAGAPLVRFLPKDSLQISEQIQSELADTDGFFGVELDPKTSSLRLAPALAPSISSKATFSRVTMF
jgi:hypothetical protein